ncbi:MAG: tripartite tricarboxylate transporter substrate binding protein [Acetobacteraceae bacterium]|nr:tripartite tricarboxylate transporter substrate binding protein [Acetobacteraceae bacterium]
MIGRRALALAGLLPFAPFRPRAEAPWRPDRPVRFIVGFGAGGPSDTVSRLVAAGMAASLGQPVVVENRAGASGNIGMQAVLQAPADGHTLGFAGIHLATNPALLPSLGYDPRADVQMVGRFVALPILVLASAQSGIGSIAGLLARARERPVVCSTAGVGTSSHLGPTLLFRTLGGAFEAVQYRSGADAFAALLAGDTEAMFDPPAPYHAPAAAQGRVRLLGVMQNERSAALPEVPSFGELGLPEAAQMRSWNGACVRAGTPAPAVAALHAAILAALGGAELRQRLSALGMEPAPSESPAAAQAHYLSEVERWGRLLRQG